MSKAIEPDIPTAIDAPRRTFQEIALLTELNCTFTLWPNAVMIPIKTVMMKPAITAYSAAVGPPSLARHRRIFEATLHILEFLPMFLSRTLDSG